MPDYTQTQKGWIGNFQQSAVVQLLGLADDLIAQTGTYASNQYGTGGTNAITDATAGGAIPQATAAMVASADGAVVAILATIAANRGYLEALRP